MLPCARQRLQNYNQVKTPIAQDFISYRDEIAKKELHSGGGDQMND